jgi:hypothetical protein
MLLVRISESRLVTQNGGPNSTMQKLKYENFLYAQWKDPHTQQICTFRIKIPDFYQFSIGEEIPIKLNFQNPNEYHLQYSPDTHLRAHQIRVEKRIHMANITTGVVIK